ncbi:MAG: FAD-dependent thymidylate synthase [Nanoarchaeota archaeon]
MDIPLVWDSKNDKYYEEIIKEEFQRIKKEKLISLLKKSIIIPILTRNDVSLKSFGEIYESTLEKYKKPEDLMKYFKKFFHNYNPFEWHLSPFGLVWVKGNNYSDKFKGQGYFSLRHVLEEKIEEGKSKEEILKFLEDNLKEINELYIPHFEKFEVPNKVYWLKSIDSENDIFEFNEGTQYLHIAKDNFDDNSTNGYWIVWDGVSRVTTHQLVRHQSFDFQQQSQRYINLSNKNNFGIYIASNEDEEEINKALHNFVNFLVDYQEKIKKGYKPEIARLDAPQRITSRIVFFALPERYKGRDGIKEFIEKRKNDSAQEEIKNFVLTLEKVIKDY